MTPMTYWFDLQKQMLDAQAKNVAAAKKGMAAMDGAVSAQKAMAKAAQSNTRLMKDWAKLWGMG